MLGLLMIAMGVAIAAVWGRDMVASSEVDRAAGLLRARDTSGGSFLMPHWIAEYVTAIGLVVGGVGRVRGASWADAVAIGALGALTYTSINSLGWALAVRDRRPYAAPMLAGAALGIGGLVSFLV